MKKEKSEHTPGPWVDSHEDPAPGLDLSGWTAICYIEDGEMQDHIAYCAPVNARLIAAAPELLAALEEIAGYHHELEHTGAMEECRAKSCIKSAGAIKKARTGEI